MSFFKASLVRLAACGVATVLGIQTYGATMNFAPGAYPGIFVTGHFGPALYVVTNATTENLQGQIAYMGRDAQPPGTNVATFTMSSDEAESWRFEWKLLEDETGGVCSLTWHDTTQGRCLAGSHGNPFDPDGRLAAVHMIWPLTNVTEHPAAMPMTETLEASPHSNHEFDVWTSENGLASNAARCVAQTPDGFVWVGTVSGLNRFDGRRWASFNTESSPALPEDNIPKLLVDRLGRLVVMTKSQGIYLYATNAFLPWPGNEQIRGRRINSLQEALDGALWFIESNGNELFRLDDQGILQTWEFNEDRLFPRFNTQKRGGVRDVYTVGDDRMLVGTRSGPKLFDWKANKIFHFPDNWDVISGGFVHGHDGDFWMGNYGGVSIYRSDLRMRRAVHVKSNGNETSSILVDSRNRWWRGQKGRLFCLDGGTAWHFPRVSEVMDSTIMALMEDGDKNIWLVSDSSGVARLTCHAVSNFDWSEEQRRDGDIRDFPMVVRSDRKNRLHIANPRGFDQWDGTNRVRRFHPNTWVRHESLAVSGDDPEDVWYGLRLFSEHYMRLSSNPGSNRFPLLARSYHGKWKEYFSDEFPLSVRTGHSVAWSRTRGIWYGTDQGLFHLQDENFYHWNPKHGLPSFDAMCVYVDGNDTVWVGTDGYGLLWIEGEKIARYHTGNSALRTDKIFSVQTGDEGSLWIGTARGLHRLKDGVIEFVRMAPPFDAFAVQMVLPDHLGNLWMGTPNGILCLTTESLASWTQNKDPDAFIRPLRFGRDDGLENETIHAEYFPAACRTKEGELIFAMSQGVTRFHPDELLATVGPGPSVIIERCSSGRDSVHFDWHQSSGQARPSTLVLPPEVQGYLSIEYFAVSQTDPAKIRYEYRLKGAGEDWQDTGGQIEQRLTRLKPGQYQFEVRAFDYHERVSPNVASLAFQISPFYYQTWSFRAGVVFLAALALFAVHRYRMVNRLRIQELHRQLSLDEERSRIARDMHDEIGSGLAQIRLLGEMAVEDETDPQKIELAQKMADRAYGSAQSLREIIWSLNPSKNKFQDLSDYTEKLVEDYFANSSVRATVNLGTTRSGMELSPQLKREFVLMLKGIMSNVLKHAEAKSFKLNLDWFEPEAALVVQAEDDGKGFDVEAIPVHSHGWQSLRERVENWQGTLEVDSTPGQGTRVKIQLPLKNCR